LITYLVEKELTGNSSGVLYYCLAGWNDPPWFGKEGEASASQSLHYGIHAFQSYRSMRLCWIALPRICSTKLTPKGSSM